MGLTLVYLLMDGELKLDCFTELTRKSTTAGSARNHKFKQTIQELPTKYETLIMI